MQRRLDHLAQTSHVQRRNGNGFLVHKDHRGPVDAQRISAFVVARHGYHSEDNFGIVVGVSGQVIF